MKSYQKIIIAGGFAVGALVVGIRGCAKNMGEEIYRGNINSQEVVYEEGIYPCGGPSSENFIFGNKNQMRVKQGNIEYTLIDEVKEISIQNPDFAEEELERIIIKTNSGKEDLRAKSKYRTTLEDIHTKSVFEKGNKLYNDLRGKIRAEIESGYRAIENQIPQ